MALVPVCASLIGECREEVEVEVLTKREDCGCHAEEEEISDAGKTGGVHACTGELVAAATVCKGDICGGLGRVPVAPVAVLLLLPLQCGACRASAKGHAAAPRGLLLLRRRTVFLPQMEDTTDGRASMAGSSSVGTAWFLACRRRVCRSSRRPPAAAAVPWACVIFLFVVRYHKKNLLTSRSMLSESRQG